VEVCARVLDGRELVADVAVVGRGLNARVRRMAREAGRVVRNSFERALLQPEGVAEILRRRGRVLVFRVALRMVGLMADAATLRVGLLLREVVGASEGGGDELNARRTHAG